MNLRKTRSATRKSTLLRVGNITCAFLGLFWAVSPLLHVVFHAAEVAHRHPTGSVHQHDHAHSHSHSHDHSEQHQDQPVSTPTPIDDSSTVVFYSLEIQSTDTVSIDIQLSEATSPLIQEISERSGFYSLAFIGAAAPRGPPV